VLTIFPYADKWTRVHVIECSIRHGPIPGGPLVYVAGSFSKWTSLTQMFLLLHGLSQHYFSSILVMKVDA
jgi:hypothetical protein